MQYIKMFFEGLLSFFSPCVLPVIPLYMGYMANTGENKSQLKIFLYTLMFCLGIFTTFGIIGASSGLLSTFFSANKIAFLFIGGTILSLLSLVSFNVVMVPDISPFRSLSSSITSKMGLLNSYLLGFIFSFSWTPCVGPMLANALLQASTAANKMTGYLYIFCYALGFTFIFFFLGLATDKGLVLLKKYNKYTKYVGYIIGIIILLSGLNMVRTGFTELNALNKRAENANEVVTNSSETTAENNVDVTQKKQVTMNDVNFTLKDIEGNEHSLTDYNDKAVIIDFTTTWCPYCRKMTPTLVNIQEKYGDDVQVILVNPFREEKISKQEVSDYYSDNYGFNGLLLFDEDSQVTSFYGVTGFPYLYFFGSDGVYNGYNPGYMEESVLEELVGELIHPTAQ